MIEKKTASTHEIHMNFRMSYVRLISVQFSSRIHVLQSKNLFSQLKLYLLRSKLLKFKYLKLATDSSGSIYVPSYIKKYPILTILVLSCFDFMTMCSNDHV